VTIQEKLDGRRWKGVCTACDAPLDRSRTYRLIGHALPASSEFQLENDGANRIVLNRF